MELAEAIAQRLPFNYFEVEDKHYLVEGELRQISSSFELKYEDDVLPAGYVFNYANNEGYVIVSADLRQEPILAFSSSDNLNQNDTIPNGMYEWAAYNIDVIQEIRVGDYYATGIDLSILQHQYQNWLNLFDDMNLTDPPTGFEKPNKWEDPTNPMDCTTPYYAKKGPYLQTNWDQNTPYNNLVNSTLNCNGQKPPTGCVATATGQILKYWSKPHANYNYAVMPNNSGNNTQIQTLMRDLGQSTHLNMNYGCGGSGAPSARVLYTLLTHFSYAGPGIYGDYTYSSRWNIKGDLDASRVLYFEGYHGVTTTVTTRKPILWIFPRQPIVTTTYSEGHAWLCDGYEAKGNNCSQQFWYHMNWGWENGRHNGWYFENSWNPPVFNFQFNRRYIRNIYP